MANATIARGAKPTTKALLYGATAMALVMTAPSVQAACTGNSPLGISGISQFGASTTLPIGSTVSGVQSIVTILSTQNTAFLTQSSALIGAPTNVAPGTNGGGVWARGIGGTFDTDTGGGFTRTGNINGGAGSGACGAKTFQDYYGMQAGADVARLNIDGYNVHAGITMGYTESKVSSDAAFRGDFHSPFVGVYGAVTKGQFFADGQIRLDFIQGNLNDPTNTLSNQKLDARSLSFTGNVGYQIPLNDGWFIEPSGGAVYSQASVDPFRTAGAIFNFPQNPQNLAAPTTVTIKDFDSLLARGSLRFGKNVVVGSYALQPFVTASVINEFASPIQTNVATNFSLYGRALAPSLGFTPAQGESAGRALDSTAKIYSQRIGLYGQFSGGIAGQLLNTGWVGYVRGDYRVGERVEGWGINGGVRYHFNPDQGGNGGASLVAGLDGPVDWTGYSLGGSVGGLWGETIAPNINTMKPAGIYAGGQIGADYQTGRVVYGVAGDAGFTNASGGGNCNSGNIGGNFNGCRSTVDDLYMATARVGVAVDRTLIYMKGGAAFAHTAVDAKSNFGGQVIPILASRLPKDVGFKDFGVGWAIGGGFEYALSRNWSAKAEYMHYQLEKQNYRVGVPFNTAFASTEHSGDLVKIGVNYRFGVASAAAAY